MAPNGISFIFQRRRTKTEVNSSFPSQKKANDLTLLRKKLAPPTPVRDRPPIHGSQVKEGKVTNKTAAMTAAAKNQAKMPNSKNAD